MCLLQGLDKKSFLNLLIFVLPQFAICGYLFFVLHVSTLGRQIKMFPSYFEDSQEQNQQGNIKQPQSISQFFYDEDSRFDQDQNDDNNFGQIAEINMENYEDENGSTTFNFQKFYHDFLSYNMPVVLRKAGTKMEAFKKWQSDDYLVSKFGEKEVDVEIRDDGENKFAYFSSNFKKQTMKYKDFIKVYQDPNRKANYYWAENNIPDEILDDIIEPEIGMFMNLEFTKMWQGASGTESLAHTDDKDNFLCQITGKKTVVLIAPTQRSKLYVGIGKKDIYNYSQVDFFNPDFKKYPLFAQVKGKMKVEISNGDMLFIPSFWFHHVKSSKERNLAINFWYTPNYMHSMLQVAFESGQYQ